MGDRHRNYHHLSRPASTNPSRSSLPAGMVYHQPSYADDSYLTTTSSRHPVTTPRGHSTSTTSSGQPATTRTYAVTQNPRSLLETRDHSHTRRSTMDSLARPPVIITTRQNDRSHNSPVHSAAPRNGSPVREDYRHANSQYYAVPASTNRSRSAARPYYGEGHTHRRDRGDSLLSPHDAESYRQPRPSATYSSNARHSAASIDYGDDGYKYTNAGELVQYDLDHSKPTRSQRHDSFNQGYYRPRASYAMDQRRNDGPRYEFDRGYAVPHERSDAHSGPPPSTRRFDKMHRDYTLDQDRQTPPAAPKPPKPLPYSETSGNFRDAGARHRRPVSVSQEPSYWNSSHYARDTLRDPHGHARDRSDDRGAEKRRPHSTHFYDDSVPNRGFGVRTSPDAAPGSRLDSRRDGKRSRDDLRRSDHLRSGEKPLSVPRKSTQDRSMPVTGEKKHSEGDRKDNSRETPHHILETAGAGLGITAATTAFAASRRDNEPAGGPGDQKDATHDSTAGDPIRHETADATMTSSSRSSAEAAKDRYSPQPEATRTNAEDSGGPSENGEASLVRYSTPSASDSDDAGRGRARRDQRPSNSFNPRDADDLRRVREQLAALRMQDSQQQGNGPLGGENERQARTPSPDKEPPGIPTPDKGDQSYAVGFPAEKKHARVVSPPRDTREDKPLRGILKQPSASFPEEANPVREGVAPHKEDKKLKEVPPGARWTKINRQVVNPEALTIGQERFEERDDFVIVLRVLSKEEIQTYAAATQVLRERRRTRDNADREQERRHRLDDDSSRHHRSHRPRGGDDGYKNAGDGKMRVNDGSIDDDGGQMSARDEGSDSSGGRGGYDGEGGRMRRSRREDGDSDMVARRRDRARGDDRDGESGRWRKPVGDNDNEREQHRGGDDRHRR